MTTQTLIRSLPVSKALAIRLPRINKKLFLVFGFGAILALSLLYVFQINEITRNGYVVSSYQKQLSNLVKDNKNLEVKLAQISYLEDIQRQTEEMNFQKVEKIKYIQVLDNSLARK